MGLGAITDLVQHAFGPVDLDRSPVELAAVTAVHPRCPACAGGRFGFPGELAEAKATMCPTHLREAESVINRRLARANASNPDGWAAITAASLATRPAAPAQRAGRQAAPAPTPRSTSSQDPMSSPSAPPPSSKRPDGFAVGPTTSPRLSGRNPSWPASGPTGWRTSSSISAQPAWESAAERVGDALAKVDPGRQASFDADVSVALAESGLADEARRPDRGQPGPLAARPLGPRARRRRTRRAGRPRGSSGAFRGRAADGRGERRL